jgi:hypothetical protein
MVVTTLCSKGTPHASTMCAAYIVALGPDLERRLVSATTVSLRCLLFGAGSEGRSALQSIETNGLHWVRFRSGITGIAAIAPNVGTRKDRVADAKLEGAHADDT